MKKNLFLTVCLVCIGMGSQAQNNEFPKAPLAPPAPPKVEMKKITPPAIVNDQEVNIVPPTAPLPPPVPPKVKMTKFTPPKILQNNEVDVEPPSTPPAPPKPKEELKKYNDQNSALKNLSVLPERFFVI